MIILCSYVCSGEMCLGDTFPGVFVRAGRCPGKACVRVDRYPADICPGGPVDGHHMSV